MQKQLRVLQLSGDFAVWDDRQIELGSNWLPAIEEAIAQARVAILLVSSDFLTSSFVVQAEIPQFLQRREKDGLKVVPIIVRPCAWQVVPWLADLQGATKDNVHLSCFELGSSQLEEELSRVVLKVHGLLVASKADELHRLEVARQAADREQRTVAAEKLRQEQLVLEREEAAQRAEQAKAQAAADAKARQEQQIRDQQVAEEKRRKAEEARQKKATVTSTKGQSEGKSYKFLGIVGVGVITVGVLAYNLQGQGSGDSATTADSEPSAAQQLVTTQPRQAGEPDMVFIKGGEFQRGCVSGKGCRSDELPVDKVKVPDFEIGKYEVTFAEWDACVADGGCNQYKPGDQQWGRDNRPVINVSWDDAQAYVAWLSKKTNKKYRLPTEAEWEYAARAGTKTVYPWGNDASHEFANYGTDTCCDGLASGKDEWKYTAPVGSFPSYAGLYDMNGNVWEWVQDCYHETYEGAPADGSEWEGACYKFSNGTVTRVLRGGSWYDAPEYLRSALRRRLKPTARINDIGFRVSRTL